MTSRKKPGLAFWATVAVVVVLLYVASMGPACWVSSRLGFCVGVVSAAYRPLIIHSPRTVSRMLDDYSRIGAAKYWCWDHPASFPTSDPNRIALGITTAWESD